MASIHVLLWSSQGDQDWERLGRTIHASGFLKFYTHGPSAQSPHNRMPPPLCGHSFLTVPRTSQKSGYGGIREHSLAASACSCSLWAGTAPRGSCSSCRVGTPHSGIWIPSWCCPAQDAQEEVSSGLPICGIKSCKLPFWLFL